MRIDEALQTIQNELETLRNYIQQQNGLISSLKYDKEVLQEALKREQEEKALLKKLLKFKEAMEGVKA